MRNPFAPSHPATVELEQQSAAAVARAERLASAQDELAARLAEVDELWEQAGGAEGVAESIANGIIMGVDAERYWRDRLADELEVAGFHIAAVRVIQALPPDPTS